MTPTERTGGRRVVLYGRETLPTPAARQRERLIDRLTVLEREGYVAGFAAERWDKRVRRDVHANEDALATYAEFSRWARERGLSLRPFFGARECYSMETGEKDDWIVFPALCLAVYEDGDLAAVFPHADGDDYRSVSDGLDALARQEAELVRAPDEESSAREPVPVGSAD